MSGALKYASPQQYPAVFTDRWGQVETVIVNDGQEFSVVLRGILFAGRSPGDLEPAGPLTDTAHHCDLHHGALCSYTIEWRMPIQVALSDAEPITALLHARLVLGDPSPNGGIDREEVTLALHLPTGVVETTTPHGWMEDALLNLQNQLPDGMRLRSCITCAFSDYNPAGNDFFGTMACFRDHKADYRAVSTKRDIFALWPSLTGLVQETYLCPDYEPRQPGTGYRG